MTSKLTQYNFKLPEDLLTALKERAASDGTNATAIIIQGIRLVLGLTEEPTHPDIYRRLYEELNSRVAQIERGSIHRDIYDRLSHLEEVVSELSKAIEYVQKEKGKNSPVSSGQLSLLDEPAIAEEEPRTEATPPLNTVLTLSLEGLEYTTGYSDRGMSKLSGKSRNTLRNHRLNNPLGTPMDATIEGAPFKIMCITSNSERRPTEWIKIPADKYLELQEASQRLSCTP